MVAASGIFDIFPWRAGHGYDDDRRMTDNSKTTTGVTARAPGPNGGTGSGASTAIDSVPREREKDLYFSVVAGTQYGTKTPPG